MAQNWAVAAVTTQQSGWAARVLRWAAVTEMAHEKRRWKETWA